MTRRLTLLLLLAAATVVLQQQLLLRRPPRLLGVEPQPLQSGRAAVDLSFSRSMHRNNLAAESSLDPALPHRWLGQGNRLRLILEGMTPIDAPIALTLAGRDQRMQPMTPQKRWWDPRPWLLVTRQVEGGEQLQLQDRQGQWHPLSPVWTSLQSLVPLGNGSGVAMVSSNGKGKETIWRKRLTPRNLALSQQQLGVPVQGVVEPLSKGDLLFGHISSNLNGDLLVQTGGLKPGSESLELLLANGERQMLKLPSSGPMQLLPAGGGLVVPGYNGISIQPLKDNGKPPQVLPGSRELGAFCSTSGRAVLIRHWPDYRRSIELVIPGLAPRQLHLGEQAVLAVSCNGSGDRIWAVLGIWQGRRSQHELVQFNSEGTVLQRRNLAPWSLSPGTGMEHNPVGNDLLMTLTQPDLKGGRAALIEADTLRLRKVMDESIKEARWLPAG